MEKRRTIKTERVQIRITPETKAKLQTLADREHRTITNCIEDLIERAISSYGRRENA